MGPRRGLLPSDDEDADESEPYAARAARLGLPFDPQVDRRHFKAVPPEGSDGDIGPIAASIRAGHAALVVLKERKLLLIAPDEADVGRLSPELARYEALRRQLVVTTPAAIRKLLQRAFGERLASDATLRLARSEPLFSARRLLTPVQGIVLALLALLVAIAGWLDGRAVLVLFDVAAGILFCALILLRMQSASLVIDRTARPPPEPRRPAGPLPVYTVLLPLYDEGHMVADLVRAMDRLDWPRDRLDVKLLVEARDRRTIAAIDALRLGAPFETVVLPDGRPRTKPRALAFALPLARGEFVTVYDAEDRPDPGQLLEAYAAFLAGGDRLACVQAPLLVDNAGQNGLTGLYAMEYSIQFDGVLPLLAALDMPLPLGGTSNHFRRGALERAGGWDPYNVTEDADLGIRLARLGFRATTIHRPTYEEAPPKIRAWLAQRTRWLKGWMQTFLVHIRQPRRLWSELGPRRFAGFVLITLGSLVSAAVHPLYLATAVAMLIDPSILWRANSPVLAGLLFLHLFNFVAAYAVFALLARLTYRMRGAERPRGALVYLPGYWLLLSVAFYRALFQLVLRPHFWAKTPHFGRRRAKPAPASPNGKAQPPLTAGAEARR